MKKKKVSRRGAEAQRASARKRQPKAVGNRERLSAPRPVSSASLRLCVPKKVLPETGKVRLELLPGSALREAAKAHDHGNRKPGRGAYNWRVRKVKASDQIGGALRHIERFKEGQDFDPVSLAHELGHAIARLNILIDAQANGTLIDDRVPVRTP